MVKIPRNWTLLPKESSSLQIWEEQQSSQLPADVKQALSFFFFLQHANHWKRLTVRCYDYQPWV